MEEVVASGQADIIEMGRQTMADPELPKAQDGRDDEITQMYALFILRGSVGGTASFIAPSTLSSGTRTRRAISPLPVRRKESSSRAAASPECRRR